MIESEGRATQLQAIEKVVDCIRQRQRNLNSAFKISYKRVLRKNHASRVSEKPLPSRGYPLYSFR